MNNNRQMTRKRIGQAKEEYKREDGEETNKQNKQSDLFASCSFSSLGIVPTLCDQLRERMGFDAPTLVQAQAIPVILSGRHVLVNAATGTGKTVAYLAPIIHHLQGYTPKIERSHGTCALVLVPTRELCLQVYETLQKLLHRFHWIVPGYLMGGENRNKEKARLRKGISILVATPGRLLDHLKHTSSFKHSNLRWIVFDEADSILELGYGKDIEEILEHLGSRLDGFVGNDDTIPKSQRQNLLLSATLNEKVNRLAKVSLDNPVMIGLDEKQMPRDLSVEGSESAEFDAEDPPMHLSKIMNSSSGDYRIPTQLVQRYVKVSCGSRLAVLLSILKYLFEREASQKVVVFFSTRDAVDFHYSLLNEFKWSPNSQPEERQLRQLFLKCKTFRLHGSMEPEDRRNTVGAFKTEKLALLLSSDLGARGLDFPKVRCIIQYDSPGEATEYVHRVGRTARLGEKGESFLFLQPIEIDYLQDLEKHRVSVAEYPLLKVMDKFPLYGQMPRVKKVVSLESHPWVILLQKALESFIYAEPKMKELAKSAFVSWVRAYAAHRGELKRIFVVKKLHLGHVAKSFALREQPSLVGRSHHNQSKKRKRDERQRGQSKKRKKVGNKG